MLLRVQPVGGARATPSHNEKCAYRRPFHGRSTAAFGCGFSQQRDLFLTLPTYDDIAVSLIFPIQLQSKKTAAVPIYSIGAVAVFLCCGTDAGQAAAERDASR